MLGPIALGAGVTVGANAVVIHDVPPGVTVVGVPARPVGAPSLAQSEVELAPPARD